MKLKIFQTENHSKKNIEHHPAIKNLYNVLFKNLVGSNLLSIQEPVLPDWNLK